MRRTMTAETLHRIDVPAASRDAYVEPKARPIGFVASGDPVFVGDLLIVDGVRHVVTSMTYKGMTEEAAKELEVPFDPDDYFLQVEGVRA